MKKELEKLVEKMENYLKWKIMLGESDDGEEQEIKTIQQTIKIIQQDLNWVGMPAEQRLKALFGLSSAGERGVKK